MKRVKLFAIFMSLSVMSAFAQPSEPESGMRWVLNRATSDEFESKKLDEVKWWNANPKSWTGRFPGLFTAEAVSQSDGKLHITVDKFDEPVEHRGKMWTHQGGHVYSKEMLNVGAYAECSMKANKTFMSSTFWLITGKSDRTGCERRTTELDIQECIGFPSDHRMTTAMSSNTHSRGIAEGCDVPAGSKGNRAKVDGLVYEGYHTYAAWWKSPREILFYLDGEYQGTVNPVADFDLPMEVKLVCETYDWSVAPEDGGMTGTKEERTTSYEWVRCYTSLPLEKKQGKYKDAGNVIFEEGVKFASNSSETLSSSEPMLGVVYTSSKGGKVSFQLKDSNGKSIESGKFTALSGMGNIPMSIKGGKLKAGKYVATAKFGDKECSETFEVK